MMDERLDLHHGEDRLELEDVLGSSTRVHLFVTLDAFEPRLMELDVQDVQDVAGWLLTWLAEHGHQLPDLPALEDDLEGAEDVLAEVHVVPEHTR